jgi:hypothetical protein
MEQSMNEFMTRNEKVKLWKVPENLADAYQKSMGEKDCHYVGEKTRTTIGKWLKVGDEKATMGVAMVAIYALSDYHDYLQKGGMNAMQMTVVKMNEDMDYEAILTSLEENLIKLY